MNDDRLAALFRDATATPPGAGFDHHDVVRASRRITTRRRVVLSGVAAVLVAVAGTGVVVAASRDQGTLASAAGAAPAAAPDINPPAAAAPENSPLIAGPGAGRAAAAPLGPSSAQCVDKHDPALRAVVQQVLPEVAGATDAATTQECELGGGRQVNVEVTDGGVAGLLNVTYQPPGSPLHPVAGAISAPTASGGTVAVSSRAVGPGAGRAPFADRLRGVLEYLAPRL